MIGTGETLRVTRICPAQPVTTMAADVEKGVDLSLAVSHHQHGVFTHVGTEEVAGVGYLALMAQEQPAAGEDLL
jgi:hypothetical protein